MRREHNHTDFLASRLFNLSSTLSEVPDDYDDRVNKGLHEIALIIQRLQYIVENRQARNRRRRKPE